MLIIQKNYKKKQTQRKKSFRVDFDWTLRAVKKQTVEPASKRSMLFKFKEGEKLNHMKTWNITMMKVEHDTDFDQKRVF